MKALIADEMPEAARSGLDALGLTVVYEPELSGTRFVSDHRRADLALRPDAE